MAEPLGRHRDTFRPALRFPTDPYKSMELPTRTKDIMKGSSSSVGLNSNSQSKRPPWELTLEALPDGPSSLSGKRVVLIIGSPPQSALSTLLSSPYLYGSLVVIAVAESINLDLLPSATTPAIRILRIRSSSSSPEPEMYTASRLTTIFEWADRVAKDWRQDFERLDDSLKPNSFMTFYEDDEINGAYRTKRRHLSMIFKSKTRPYHDARSAEELSGSSPFSHWSSVTASTHSRNGSSATVSSISSSYFEPSGEGGGRSSFQSTESGPYPGESTSSTGNLLNTNDSSAAKTRAIRPSASSSTLTHLSTPTYKGNTRNTLPFTSSPLASSINLTRQRTRPISVFSTFSIPGMGPPKASRERRPSSNSSTLDKPKRSFDIIINFLPPAASHGTLGNGAIATLSSSAAHAKVLLKQTILVTTASQRFLLPPVVVRRSRPAENANGTSSPRSSLLAMPEFDDVIAPEIRDGQENNLGQPGGRRSRGSTSRRISQAFGSMFSVRTSTELPPTPPSSESASETSASPPLDNTQPSARSSVSEYPTMSSGVTNNQAHPVAKLVHVLPFEHACQAHQAIGTGVGNARLVRSLEAFLLSWSYGTSGSSLSTSSSGSSSSLNSLESGDGGSIQSSSVTSNGAKGKIKPFLLDLSGFVDALHMEGPPEDKSNVWPISLLILLGMLDDSTSETDAEYGEHLSSLPIPLSKPGIGRPATAPSVTITAPPSNLPSTSLQSLSRWGTSQATSRWESTSGLASIGKVMPDGGYTDSSWATKRAWIGGADDIQMTSANGSTLGIHHNGGQLTCQGSSAGGSSRNTRIRRHSIGVSTSGLAPPCNSTKLSHVRSVTGPSDVKGPLIRPLSAAPGSSNPPTSWSGQSASSNAARSINKPVVVVNTAVLGSSDRRPGKSPLSKSSSPTSATSHASTVIDTSVDISGSVHVQRSPTISTPLHHRFSSHIPPITPPLSPANSSQNSQFTANNPAEYQKALSDKSSTLDFPSAVIKESPSALTIKAVSGPRFLESSDSTPSGTTGRNVDKSLPSIPQASPTTFRRWALNQDVPGDVDTLHQGKRTPSDLSDADGLSESRNPTKEKKWWTQAARLLARKSRL